MARRNIIQQSDDDDAQDSPPGLMDKSESEDESDDDDASTSGAGFIDDRTLEELTERSESPEEGFEEHVAESRDKTPPSRAREPAKFPQDPDDDDVEEAEGFQADLVESPRKAKRVLKKAASTQSESEADESAMDVSPLPVKKKRAAKVKAKVTTEDEDPPVDASPSKKTTAKTKKIQAASEQESDDASDDKMNVSPVRGKGAKKTAATKAGVKVVIKKEEASDEEVAPAKPSTKPKAAPSKKAEVVVISDSGSDDVEITGHKKAAAKKTANKKPVKAVPAKRAPRKKPISPETVPDSEDDAAADLKLSKDDKMYPESKSAKVLAANLKRGLPITPPLATRSSSKKQKLEGGSIDTGSVRPLSYAEAVSSPPRKAAMPIRKAKARAVDDEEVEATDSDTADAKKTIIAKKRTAADDDDDSPDTPEPLKKSSGSKASSSSPKKPVAKKTKNDHVDNASPEPAPSKKVSVLKKPSVAVEKEDAAPTPKPSSTKKPALANKSKAVADANDADDVPTPKPASKKKPVATKKKLEAAAVDEDDGDDDASPVTAPVKKSPVKKATVVADADDAGSKVVKKPAARKNKATDANQDKGSTSKTPSAKKSKVADQKENSEDEAANEDDAQNPELSSEELPDLATDPAFQAALKSPVKKAVKVEEDVFEAPSGSSKYGSPDQRYSDKIWKALPPVAVCEVYDPELLDPYLSSQRSYCELKNIPGKANGNDLDPGTIFLGKWNTIIPKETFSATVKLVGMSRQGRYIQPSRVPLDQLYARRMADNRHELAIDDRTAVSVSVINVRESGLKKPMGDTFLYHGVRGIPLTYEAQREPAVWGEISRRSTLHTPLYNSVVNFVTKMVPNNDRGPKRKAVDLSSEFFNRYRSPKKGRAVDAGILNDHIGGLEFNDNIPVYDARYLDDGFEFTEDVFMNPASYFTLMDWSEFREYKGEIPDNSLCIVGYVTQIYNYRDDNKPKESEDDSNDKKGKKKAEDPDDVEPAKLRVNMFIQWVFIIGIIN